MNRRDPVRLGLLWAAVGIVPVVIAAVALAVSADQVHTAAVRSLARAPAGCETELNIERTGDFFVYVETRGHQEALEGDCTTVARPFESRIDRPRVILELRRGSTPVSISRTSGVEYSTAGYTGELVRRFRIDTPGVHHLTVRSEQEVVVAIGVDVNAVYVQRMRLVTWTALAAVALFLGLWFVVAVGVSRRRHRAQVGSAMPPPPVGVTVARVTEPSGPPMWPPPTWPPQSGGGPPAQ